MSLKSLGYSDRSLKGPFDASDYYFHLPAEWQPLPGGYLELQVDYTVGGEWSQVPALLTVALNGSVLSTFMLDTPGTLQLGLEIPPDTLRAPESSYPNNLHLALQADADCEFPQRTVLTVRASSVLQFVYGDRPLPIDLALYPKPIHYSHSFVHGQVRFILPTGPTQAEVRAATMIAARLGRLTYNNLEISASFLPDIASATTVDENLIVIGQPSHLPFLEDLELPVKLMERQLALHSDMPAAVMPGQLFSYTLTVRNTSQVGQTLILEDRLPEDAIFVGCQGQCQASAPGMIRWQVGHLAPGEQASTVVNLELDADASFGQSQEHTASLFDGDGNLLNVDTLAPEVVAADEDGVVASAAEKGDFMFVLDDHGAAEGDGIIQEIVSPWSARRVLIVVTGLSDTALLNAALALGSESGFPGMAGPYALVRSVQAEPEETTEPVQDMSFASLGYEDKVLEMISADSTRYAFDLAGEWVVADDAGLVLHFAHGAALSAITSTLEIQLNQTPVGSVRLDEQNANDIWLPFRLPRTPLRAGRNYLDLALAGHVDRCAVVRESQLWLTIYADSGLHISHSNAGLPLDLAQYPQPFSAPGDLSDVVFSLPFRPTAVELEGTLRLAAWLGNASRGSDFLPQVALGGDPKSEPWTGFDIIAIGRPTSNPYIAAVNEALPQPFRPGTDEIRQQVDSLVYRLPAGVSSGYVQELPSPHDQDRTMLAVTGTTDEGVAWALAALVDDARAGRLAGNLVLVQGDDVRVIDTRAQTTADMVDFTQTFATHLSPQATVTPTPIVPLLSPTPGADATSVLAATPDYATSASVKSYRPGFLVLPLVLSVAVVVIGLGVAVRRKRL